MKNEKMILGYYIDMDSRNFWSSTPKRVEDSKHRWLPHFFAGNRQLALKRSAHSTVS